MDLVDDQQGAVAAHLGEVQVGGSCDALIGGDVAGEAAGGIGFVVGGPDAETMAERLPPPWIGEGLLGLKAQAVARHHPDHAIDRSGRDQPRRGDDGQEALATARGDGGEDVANAREFARRDGLDEAGDLGLMDSKRAVGG